MENRLETVFVIFVNFCKNPFVCFCDLLKKAAPHRTERRLCVP